MKRLIILIGLIGMLCNIPAAGFSQTKLKRKTIKYENGDRYVGETQIIKKTNKKKCRIKSGKGILYYKNGDVFDGTFLSDLPYEGELRYANGNRYVGTFSSEAPDNGTLLYKNGDIFEGKNLRYGKLTFSSNGTINIGSDQWQYPANSSFTGDIKSWSGEFGCILKNQKGDVFRGKLKGNRLGSGRIDYANGDSFEGSFDYSSSPKNGKYIYASATVVKGWRIPEGCSFTGDIAKFTGEADKELIDVKGNKFSGKFKSGQPDEGTMTYAVTGRKETGRWVNGLSPKAYKHQQDSIAFVRAEQERSREIKRKQIEKEQIEKATDTLNRYVDKYINFGFGHREFTRIYASNTDKDTLKALYNKFKPALLPLLQQLINKELYHNGKKLGICKSINWEQNSLVMIYEKGEVQTRKMIKYIDINHRFLSENQCNCQVPSDLKIDRAISISFPASDWGDSDGPVFRLIDINIAKSRLKNYYYKKFGPYYGEKIINGKIELGMPIAVVQAIKGEGEKKEFISDWAPHLVELKYGWGYAYECYTFLDGKLNSISK